MMNNTHRTVNASHWDVVIVGAGPAGAAVGKTIANAGFSVLIADRRDHHIEKFGECAPPAAVGPIQALLGPLTENTMQLWGLEKSPGNVSTWSDDAPQMVDFFFSTVGHGLALDRRRLDPALIAAAQEAGCEYAPATSFVDCRRRSGGWSLNLAGACGPVNLDTRFLVDASGRSAVICRALGVERLQADLLFAVGQHWVSEKVDEDGFTRVEAVEDGWWYSQRIPGVDSDLSMRRVVFHTDRDLPPAREAARPLGFARLLGRTRHMKAMLDAWDYQPSGHLRGACACSARQSQFAGDGWLAVGDAAQSYDPLSSEGITKALISGIDAGRRIVRVLSEGAHLRQPIKDFAQTQASDWLRYASRYRKAYQSQRRWSSHPFWSRRVDDEAHAPIHPLRDVS